MATFFLLNLRLWLSPRAKAQNGQIGSTRGFVMTLFQSPWPCLLVACSFMLGCANYSPGSLPTGSTVADALAKLGKPSGEYTLPGGGKRLEFARGPAGLHTFMVDFDAAGLLASWSQVLTEESFATITNGMRRDEVLMRLGHTKNTFAIWSGQQTVWAYRFDSPQCKWFMVGLNPEGLVASTSYGPDPRCEVGGKDARN
jgi:hypothetical protein